MDHKGENESAAFAFLHRNRRRRLCKQHLSRSASTWPPWLPDGYSKKNRVYVFCPLGVKDYGSAVLPCKMWSLPFLALHPPTRTIQGKEGIKFCHLATLVASGQMNQRRTNSQIMTTFRGANTNITTLQRPIDPLSDIQQDMGLGWRGVRKK